jgi:hypothetical protein
MDEFVLRYYDMDGNYITREEWGAQINDIEYRRVGFDRIGDIEISTVLIGIDHNFMDGPPLIFETMIFGGELSDEQWRYSTKEEALAGHEAAVTLAQGYVSAER